MKTKAVKVLCLVLVVMLTFSAISPFAAGEEYVDNEAYIQREQEEPEADISIDVEMSEGESIETEFDPYWFYNLPPEEGDPVDFWELPVVPDDRWQEYSRIQPLSVDTPTVFVDAGEITSTSVRLGANIISAGGTGLTIIERRFSIGRADGVGGTREYNAETNAGNIFSRTITGLEPDTQYIVQSIVRNSNGTIGVSFVLPFTTLPAAGNQPTVPSPPRNLIATAGDDSAGINWLPPLNDGGSPILYYQVSINGGVFRNIDDVAGFGAFAELSEIGISPVLATVATIFNLAGGQQHTLRIRAVNSVGPSDPSNTATVVSHIPPPPILEIDETPWEMTAAGGTRTVTVSSNTTWGVTISDSNWLIVTPTLGANNGSFTVTVRPNTTSTPNTGTITIITIGGFGTPVTRRINVTQEVGVRLTFNVNGGVGTPTPVYAPPNFPIANLPTPSRPGGYTFRGWYTAPTGSIGAGTRRIQVGDTVPGNTTLYARWYVTITLNPAGGTVSPVTVRRPSGYPMGDFGALPIPGGSDATFSGWYTARGSQGQQVTGNRVIPNNNATYYARWSIWNTYAPFVEFWPGAITVHSQIHGSPSGGFWFDMWLLEAVAMWSYVLGGVPIGWAPTEESAQIRAHGGVQADVQNNTYLRFTPGVAGGVHRPTMAPVVGTMTVDGIERDVRMRTEPVYIFVNARFRGDNWWQEQRNRTRSTTIHEVGHALGYVGHSSDPREIMWVANTDVTTLHPNEIKHLRQVYDRFR